MNATIEKSLRTLANTSDDEIATRAVEALVAAGGDSVGPLCGLLTVEALDDRTTDCSNSERLYYVLKALAAIGDKTALRRAAAFYIDVDRRAEETGNSKYSASLHHLLAFMKRVDAGAAAELSSVDLGDFEVVVTRRADICAIVQRIATA